MSADRALQALLALIFLGVLVASRDLPLQAAVAPMLAAGVGLAAIVLVALRQPSRSRQGAPDWPQLAGSGALLAAVGVAGLVIGGGVALYALLRWQARLTRPRALAVAVGWIVIAEVVFNRLLSGQLYRGIFALL